MIARPQNAEAVILPTPESEDAIRSRRQELRAMQDFPRRYQISRSYRGSPPVLWVNLLKLYVYHPIDPTEFVRVVAQAAEQLHPRPLYAGRARGARSDRSQYNFRDRFRGIALRFFEPCTCFLGEADRLHSSESSGIAVGIQRARRDSATERGKAAEIGFYLQTLLRLYPLRGTCFVDCDSPL